MGLNKLTQNVKIWYLNGLETSQEETSVIV